MAILVKDPSGKSYPINIGLIGNKGFGFEGDAAIDYDLSADAPTVVYEDDHFQVTYHMLTPDAPKQLPQVSHHFLAMVSGAANINDQALAEDTGCLVDASTDIELTVEQPSVLMLLKLKALV